MRGPRAGVIDRFASVLDQQTVHAPAGAMTGTTTSIWRIVLSFRPESAASIPDIRVSVCGLSPMGPGGPIVSAAVGALSG